MPRWVWFALVVLVLAAAAGGGYVIYSQREEERKNETELAPVIAAAERQNGLPAGLLHRQLYQESHFRTEIIDGTRRSSAGAVGVAQIIPRWHPGVNPLDPIASIYYAAAYMAGLYQRFGSWSIALAAYNWGPTNVAKHLATHGGLNLAALPDETSSYVSDITTDAGVA